MQAKNNKKRLLISHSPVANYQSTTHLQGRKAPHAIVIVVLHQRGKMGKRELVNETGTHIIIIIIVIVAGRRQRSCRILQNLICLFRLRLLFKWKRDGREGEDQDE